MKNILTLSFALAAVCSAQGPTSTATTGNAATRLSAEEVSSRMRARLEALNVRFDDVTRAAAQGRLNTKSVSEHTARPESTSTSADALNTADQKTLDRIVRIYNVVYKVYSAAGFLNSAPQLFYSTSNTINAYAQSGDRVVVYLALAELVHESDSELAIAIAHELGHIVQQRDNTLYFVPDNPEFDADAWGALITFVAGYDPYAGAGTLAKLSMATGDVGLAQQFEDQAAADAHKSFVTRIEVMYDTLRAVCSIDASFAKACAQYKAAVHPHFPANAVL